MSLLPPSPTSAQSAATVIQNNIQFIFDTMVFKHNETHQAFWYNPGATPQDISACFGTSAAALFQASATNATNVATAAGVLGIAVPNLAGVPDGCTATPNVDGIVTIVIPTPWPPP